MMVVLAVMMLMMFHAIQNKASVGKLHVVCCILVHDLVLWHGAEREQWQELFFSHWQLFIKDGCVCEGHFASMLHKIMQ